MSSSKQETSNKLNHKLLTQELEKFEELFEIPTLPHIPKLYDNILDDKLRDYFIVAHSIILESYQFVNHSLSTNCYYHAPKSRRLRACIKSLFNLQKKLSDTPLSFKIDPYYTSIFTESLNVIADGPSYLPKDWETVRLPNSKPIFTLLNAINIEHTPTHIMASELHEIGKGSFATVYKFHDSYLGIDLALKRAHKNSTDKILERFKKEFEKLHNLDSPYIIDVYSYNDFDKEYTMEFIPTTLKEFLDRNPSNDIRYLIVKQLFKVLKYIHSVDTLHRDLSYNNVLIKEYEDGSVVIKLCDFGLMKDKNFDMTSTNSEAKATHLAPEIFSGKVSQKDFDIPQEIFSLAIVIKYIMTAGTEKTLHSLPKKERDAIEKGMSSDPKERYQTIDEFQSDFF